MASFFFSEILNVIIISLNVKYICNILKKRWIVKTYTLFVFLQAMPKRLLFLLIVAETEKTQRVPKWVVTLLKLTINKSVRVEPFEKCSIGTSGSVCSFQQSPIVSDEPSQMAKIIAAVKRIYSHFRIKYISFSRIENLSLFNH